MIDSFSGQHDWASNFYFKAPFYVQGQKFSSSEHYFSACKTTDAEWCARIIAARTAAGAKKLGQQCPIRPNWKSELRVGVMAQALWYKFTQNLDIQQKLIETGAQMLVEGNYWHDNFWGDCRCNNRLGSRPECLQPGKNSLGFLLMNLRQYFQTIQSIRLF